jgi:hypothetical protein
LETGLTTAYLGLLVGRGFIDVQDHEEFFSSEWPQLREASGLRVVVSAAHLNAEHNASRLRLRTLDRRQRSTVLPSGRSSSFGYSATKPAAQLFHFERYAHQQLETVGPAGQPFVTGLTTS